MKRWICAVLRFHVAEEVIELAQKELLVALLGDARGFQRSTKALTVMRMGKEA